MPAASNDSAYVPPAQQRSLRACMICGAVQVYSKFFQKGCPNCEGTLALAGNSDTIQECTSQVYEGLLAMNNSQSSWVAKWLRMENNARGTYAVKVVGEPSPEISSSLEAAGVNYIPRDGSAGDEEAA